MAVYVSKHPTKDGRKYYFRIRYKDIYGNSIDYSSGKFKHKKEAEYAESIKRIEVASNNVRVVDVTFKQVFNEYIVKKSKQIKLQSVEKTKVLFEKLKSIQDTKPDEFNLTKYKKLQAELEKKKFSVDYMNKIFNLLINLIKYSKKYYGTSDTILDFIEKYVDPNKIKQEMLFFTYEEYL